jgi:gluconate 2-dehydrogenase gamma chain
MDRRKSLKAIALAPLTAGLLAESCKPGGKPADVKPEETNAKAAPAYDRMKEEQAHYEKVISEQFFSKEELATITLLADIIIPADEVSGSASQAGVPAFIEFIVKDMPEHQTPMRGGLRWLDLQCAKRFDNAFKDCTQQQQMEIVDDIAWPEKAKPEMAQGVAFFNLMRNLTATGFYTSEMGVKDIGYIGNAPNQWNGIPEDVQKQYGFTYTEKELKECLSFD